MPTAYERQCKGKPRFVSDYGADEAMQVAEATTGERFKMYTCRYCGYIHVGHAVPEPLRRGVGEQG